MSSKWQLFTRLVALVLTISLSQLTALAVSADADSGRATRAVAGTLLLRGSLRASLNGSEVGSGTTVFSGAQIATSQVGAVVQLPTLGRLEVAPATSLSLVYDASSVTVNLASGWATLATEEGIEGLVLGPDGKPVGAAPEPNVPPQGRGNTHGLRRALLVTLAAGAAGAIIIAAIIANRESDNPSPFRPS